MNKKPKKLPPAGTLAAAVSLAFLATAAAFAVALLVVDLVTR